MISIKNISEVKKEEFDEIYAIVNSVDEEFSWIRRIKPLSPSDALFNMSQDIKERGNWNEDTFNNVYVPRYLKQIINSNEAKQVLNYLYKNSKTKNIALVCYCKEEYLCHRSIIIGLLQGVKANINCKIDYSKYYKLFNEMKNQK